MALVRNVLEHKGYGVHHVHPDATVLDAVRTMAEFEIGALVVLEDEHLVGLITERDYARKIILQGRTSPGTPVREIMCNRPLAAAVIPSCACEVNATSAWRARRGLAG
jgi:CBS domain-containing protein